jgi:hypothetical protein
VVNAKRIAPDLAAFVLYLGAALIVTYPLVTTLDTRLIGHPFGDAAEYVHHIWWIKHALQTGQDPFFQPLLLYPRGLSAAWLWGAPLQSFPAWLLAFALPLPAAFNLAALLTLALNGWALFRLAKTFVAPLPALLAGAIFMLYPAFQGHLAAAHTGLITVWGAPLFLLALIRRRIVIGAALFAVALWGSPLLLIYLFAPILGVYLLALIRRRDGRQVRGALLTLALGGVFAAPFVVPIWRESGAVEAGAVRYSASLLSIAAPSFNHPLFGGLEYARRILGVDPFEGAAYIGVITAGLCIVGVITRREARWWLIAALLAWVLSLGALLKLDGAPLMVRVGGYATAIPLPGGLLDTALSIVRTPGRFNFAIGFAAAIMAGCGADTLMRRIAPRVRWFTLIGLAALIAVDYQLFFPVPSVDAAIPAPISALAERADVRAVFDVPFAHPLVDKAALYLQTAHQQPIIGGHITRQTPLDPAVGWLLQTFDPALLDQAGVDVVILHREWDDPALEADAYARLGAPIYEDARYAVFEIAPSTGDLPSFTWISRVGEAVTDSAAVYFYAPVPGTVTLRGRIDADGRGAALRLDGAALVTWTVSGAQGWNLPLTVREPGFHTLTLSTQPACPPLNDPTLACRPLRVDQLELTDYRPLRRP